MTFFSDILSFVSDHWLSALVFILIFSVLIVLHELGHFWAARKAGVGVLEFGFGLPPKVWGKKTSRNVTVQNGEKSEVKTDEMEWTLNAIPFGGFVRLEGEEEKSDTPTSFGNRPLGWRILVVCGGVIMNFILGWGLLTIGYGVGMNPLAPSEAQKEQYVAEGIWDKQEDEVVVVKLPKSEEESSFQMFDIVKTVDGHDVTTAEDFNMFYSLAQAQKKTSVPVVVKRFSSAEQRFADITEEVTIVENSPFTSTVGEVEIALVGEDSPAEAIGMKKGDIIVAVEQGEIKTANQFIKTAARHFEQGKKNVRISLIRKNDGGEVENITFIAPFNRDGKLGISIRNAEGAAEKNKILLESRTLYIPVQKVQYSWVEAPVEAYHESVRWMGQSVQMVGKVVSSIASDQKIPDEVGGPAAIAHTTDKLVGLGDWTKILQFTAILSLSLAVVNIMPFPGLDGGRLFFLIGEGIMRVFSQLLFWAGLRKKALPTQLPEKYEMPLHAVGYFLLLGLILWITWNDIMRIFF